MSNPFRSVMQLLAAIGIGVGGFFAQLAFAAHPCDVQKVPAQREACLKLYAENERRAAEQARQAAQQREAERQRQAQAEAQRKAEQQRQAQAEAQRKAEQQRQAQAEAQRKAEQQRQAQAEAQRKAEQQRQAQAEAQHKAEQQRQAQAEAQRKAEQQRQAQAEGQRKAEQQRQVPMDAKVGAGAGSPPKATPQPVQSSTGKSLGNTPVALPQKEPEVQQKSGLPPLSEKAKPTNLEAQRKAIIDQEVARRMALQGMASGGVPPVTAGSTPPLATQGKLNTRPASVDVNNSSSSNASGNTTVTKSSQQTSPPSAVLNDKKTPDTEPKRGPAFLQPVTSGQLVTARSTPPTADLDAEKKFNLFSTCGSDFSRKAKGIDRVADAAKASAVKALTSVNGVGNATLNWISFEAACGAHDACYGRRDCDKSKPACDDAFLSDMVKVCNGASFDVQKRTCYDQAQMYYGAVVNLGFNAYNESHGNLSCRARK